MESWVRGSFWLSNVPGLGNVKKRRACLGYDPCIQLNVGGERDFGDLFFYSYDIFWMIGDLFQYLVDVGDLVDVDIF